LESEKRSISICYNLRTKKLNEDISVPRSKLPEALEKIYEIGSKYSLMFPWFWTAGDGKYSV